MVKILTFLKGPIFRTVYYAPGFVRFPGAPYTLGWKISAAFYVRINLSAKKYPPRYSISISPHEVSSDIVIIAYGFRRRKYIITLPSTATFPSLPEIQSEIQIQQTSFLPLIPKLETEFIYQSKLSVNSLIFLDIPLVQVSLPEQPELFT